MLTIVCNNHMLEFRMQISIIPFENTIITDNQINISKIVDELNFPYTTTVVVHCAYDCSEVRI